MSEIPVSPRRLRALQEARQGRDEEDQPGPEAELGVSLDVVRALPLSECAVVLLVFWGNLSLAQVSAVCQRSRTTVGKTLAGAMKRLRAGRADAAGR